MALAYRTIRAIPYIPTYELASQHEARVKPVRGDANNLKPLGVRSQKWQHIKRDLTTGNIDVYLGSTKLISYEPGGTIHIYGPTWSHKAVIGDVINAALGWQWRSEDHTMWIMSQGGWMPLEKGVMNAFTPTVKLSVNHLGNRSRVVQTEVTDIPTKTKKVTVVSYEVNRPGKREVMQQFKAFFKYVEVMLKLRIPNGDQKVSEVASLDEVCNEFGYDTYQAYGGVERKVPKLPIALNWMNHPRDHADAQKLVDLMASEDPGDQYKAFLLTFRSVSGWLDFNALKQHAHDICTRAAMMVNHDKCLTKVEHDPGQIVRNRYRWALPKK